MGSIDCPCIDTSIYLVEKAQCNITVGTENVPGVWIHNSPTTIETGAGVSHDVIDKVAANSSFGAMKAKAGDYAPVGGTGFWKNDQNFFDSAQSRKWEGMLTDEDLALYRDRLGELVPDEQARNWLENGGAL